jgi:UDP-glucose 4-epimerase
MKIFLTGGAGYIGSHILLALEEAKHDVVTVDDLSKGSEEAVRYGRLIKGDIGDKALMQDVFAQEQFDAVIHMAAYTEVEESTKLPLKYFNNNTGNTLLLLELCKEHGIKHFIFSSTAAVYAPPPNQELLKETDKIAPENPYGLSKYLAEEMIRESAVETGMSHVILRYFNVAGADTQGRSGQRWPKATHLIKVACQAAVGLRDGMAVFGTDYDTPDGTCVRDYIHVTDLAQAHIDALNYLANDGEPCTLNCGYGQGTSVAEIMEIFKDKMGCTFPVKQEDRRPGDASYLAADNTAIQKTLGWNPRHNNLEEIVRSALEWEKAMKA